MVGGNESVLPDWFPIYTHEEVQIMGEGPL
jgi:hypothetical protein